MGQSESPERSGTRRKKVIAVTAGLLLLCSVGISLAVYDRDPLQDYLPWRVQRLMRFLDNTSIFDLRACLCASDKEVTLTREDGLKVAGSLYGLNPSEKKAGILLLHGHTPVGRNLALYRIMAKKFAEWDYLVMTIDFTGFGESDDPFSFEVEGALDRDRDVEAALKYLRSLDELQGAKLYLIGHSMGASPAMRIGLRDSMVAGIVAIGPSRRVANRLSDLQDSDYFWRRAQKTRQKVYGKPYPLWYTKEKWLKRTMRNDLNQYLPYFSQATHNPLLLIDGELEGDKDKLYLQNYFKQLAGNAKHITISGSDHYSNSLGFMGLNIYNWNTMNQTVSEVVQWVRGLEEQ